MCLLRIKYDDKNALFELTTQISKIIDDDTVIICIGTDRCILDSLGPVVGKILESMNIKNTIYGIIGETINALNINEKLEYIKSMHPTSKIVAIDACVGSKRSIGQIHVYKGPIIPGEGVGKSLPSIGDYSIIGIVSDSDLFSSKDLNFVVNMAEVIAFSMNFNKSINNYEYQKMNLSTNGYEFVYDQSIKKVVYGKQEDLIKSDIDNNTNNPIYSNIFYNKVNEILMRVLLVVILMWSFL